MKSGTDIDGLSVSRFSAYCSAKLQQIFDAANQLYRDPIVFRSSCAKQHIIAQTDARPRPCFRVGKMWYFYGVSHFFRYFSFKSKKSRTFAPSNVGKMPEWTNGPHSKCGVRVTVPGVRIPLFPQAIHAPLPIRKASHSEAFFMSRHGVSMLAWIVTMSGHENGHVSGSC